MFPLKLLFLYLSVAHCFSLYNNNQSSSHLLTNRFKRAIVFDKTKLNVPYEPCVSIYGKTGHCKHIAYCTTQKDNIYKLLDHLCIIEGKHIGVCCPDDIGSFDTKGSSLVYHLPSTGDADIPQRADFRSNAFRTPINRGCGVSTSRNPVMQNDRVSWPWIASILAYGEQPFCGGALITERHILTAAHCFTRFTKDDLMVRLGEYDFDRENETRYFESAVINMIIHEEFDPANYDNDIAILELENSTLFNSYIWPICLPPLNGNYEGRVGIVIGWGTVSYSGPSSGRLLEVELPIWRADECQNSLTQPLTDTVMCAAGYDGGKDTCQGDSGGPLMYQLPNKRWINIGIVSWGVRCGEKGKPAIYTKVDRYLQWIEQQTNNLS